MTALEQGMVVLVPFPYSNLADYKTRPALVISNSGFHGHDAIFCAITSRVLQGSGISLSDKDLEKGRLPVVSYIKPGKIFTLEKSLIRKVVAKISEEKRRLVAAELVKMLKPTSRNIVAKLDV